MSQPEIDQAVFDVWAGGDEAHAMMTRIGGILAADPGPTQALADHVFAALRIAFRRGFAAGRLQACGYEPPAEPAVDVPF